MDWASLTGSALTVATSGYAVVALWASWRAGRRVGDDGDGDGLAVTAHTPGPSPARGRGERGGGRAVSVLKPLCGDEPRLYANLVTFCRQVHPRFQLVFGVREAGDPAIAVVRRLREDYPECDIALVVDAQSHGRNPKISNLINMLPAAAHDLLVIADSDVSVPRDWLERVTAPLDDDGVGIVTCLYRARPLGGVWARMGAQFIDTWFVPAVRIAQAAGSQRFGFGPTIAIRRDTLVAIGGFEAVADRLADDYWLGELTRRRQLRSVLSDVVVTTDVVDDGLRALWLHELRWMRTIRALDPRGFALMFITFVWPMLALGLALDPVAPVAVVAVIGAIARTLLCADIGAALAAPLRDVLLLAEWLMALAGRRVTWRRVEWVAERESVGMGVDGAALPSPPAPLPRAGEGRVVVVRPGLPSPPTPLPQAGEGRTPGPERRTQ